MSITAQELRKKYLDFFKDKEHSVIASSSLVPENDPTVLFTTAGMHPLTPYLMGENHPGGKRVTSVQKCVRTDDIEEVGDTTHHTFFEMLGNWSFGDYFKEDAIKWSWEFLAEVLEIDKNRLAVSIFAGDKDAPLDEESKKIWLALGVPESRIAALPKKNNWWGPAGQTGPCGPDTEMFYWAGEETPPTAFDPDDSRWVEIWNDVFMQYNKQADGSFAPLKQQNVDTGMGLERTLAVLNGLDDNYRTELFWPIIEKIEELSDKTYDSYKKEMRIIADHVKAAVFMIADGAVPFKTGRGYVTRKLIRRAMHQMGELSIKKNSLSELVNAVVDIYGDEYDSLKKKVEQIQAEIKQDDEKAERSIEVGLKAFRELETKKLKGEPMTGEEAALFQQTHGLSKENFIGLAREYGRKLSENFEIEFKETTKKHQSLSRTASAGKFAGGLADHGEMALKYHTATHLLHAALREILGKHVQQRGSNITAERLRFDFSHPEKMTDDEKQKVENLVNAAIERDYRVSFKEMSVAEAKQGGAMGLFADKYGEKVKVYTIGDPDGKPQADAAATTFSKEICGGPHVSSTGILGKFKLKKEEASSAGVRRIKAVLV